MTITSSTGWKAIGTHRQLAGARIFTVDAPSIGAERHPPLLVRLEGVGHYPMIEAPQRYLDAVLPGLG
jgi:pimeloyl-ACP methyl ester carboxylesterase